MILIQLTEPRGRSARSRPAPRGRGPCAGAERAQSCGSERCSWAAQQGLPAHHPGWRLQVLNAGKNIPGEEIET